MPLDNNQYFSPYPVYLPDGKPAPLILTEQELVVLLRLDENSGGPKNPKDTLEYYRKQGLRAIQIGKRLRYYLPDVVVFLQNQSNWTNRTPGEKNHKNGASQPSHAAVKYGG